MTAISHDAEVSSPSAETPQRAWQPWLVCFTAALFFFFEFAQLNLFNAIDPSLMREFHISAAYLGQLSAHYFYGDVLFLLAAGIILDRVSTRWVIILGMSLSVISTFVFALSTSFTVAEISRFTTGIAAAFCFLSSMRLASRWFPPERLALVIGLIVTMAMTGGMVAQTPMTLLTDALGWRKALFIDAGIGVIILIAIIAIVRDYPAHMKATLIQQQQVLHRLGFWHSLGRTIINLQNWFAGLYTCLLNLPIFLLGAIWGSLYLVQVHHFTRAQASYITTMIFVGTIIGSPTLGWLSDQLRRRKLPMIVGAIVSLIIIFFIIYWPQFNLWQGMLLFLLLGFFTSTQIISYPLIAESNPRPLTGTAGGLASTLIMAGGAAQPFFGWLMGRHWDHTTLNGVAIYSAHNYQTALLIMPVAFVLGLIVTLLIKETHCRARS